MLVQKIALVGLFNFEGSAPVENIRHQATMSRIEMLNHYDNGGKAFRQRAQYLTKRFQAARGSGKRYDIEAMADAGSISCVIVRNRVSATYDSASADNSVT